MARRRGGFRAVVFSIGEFSFDRRDACGLFCSNSGLLWFLIPGVLGCSYWGLNESPVAQSLARFAELAQVRAALERCSNGLSHQGSHRTCEVPTWLINALRKFIETGVKTLLRKLANFLLRNSIGHGRCACRLGREH